MGQIRLRFAPNVSYACPCLSSSFSYHASTTTVRVLVHQHCICMPSFMRSFHNAKA